MTEHAPLDGPAPGLSRRRLLTLAGLGAVGAPVLAACGRLTGGNTAPAPGATGGGSVVFLSTQFTPLEEAGKFRTILKGVYPGQVDFVTADPGPFTDQVRTAVQTKSGRISLLGALHGQLAPVAKDLEPLDDVIGQLGDRGYAKNLLQLAKLGTGNTLYVPWSQATFIMAAHKSALDTLPSGADVNALTYDQLLAWGVALKAKFGRPVLGLPAGPKGLLHRFWQGFMYPSFTGGAISKFSGPDAAAMWSYAQKLWQTCAPASTSYDFMQEPMARGEVLVAWDHVARLVNALNAKPNDFVAFPAPAGPKGRGFMAVVTALAIPKGGGNKAGAVELIKALTTPQAQVAVLKDLAFFPATKTSVPSDIGGGIALEAKAVAAQQQASDALLALPPAGLGSKEGEFTQVYKDLFTAIVLKGTNPTQALPGAAQAMQKLIDAAGATCWEPDPPSTGPCKVG